MKRPVSGSSVILASTPLRRHPPDARTSPLLCPDARLGSASNSRCPSRRRDRCRHSQGLGACVASRFLHAKLPLTPYPSTSPDPGTFSYYEHKTLHWAPPTEQHAPRRPTLAEKDRRSAVLIRANVAATGGKRQKTQPGLTTYGSCSRAAHALL
jgi:hypothetical protein